MVSVLLVDDEYLVLQWLRETIDWTGLKAEVVGEALNGRDALAKVDKLQPDIVVTDIRLPLMDGIELTKQIRENYPAVKIILLSGYGEFDYAQQAIQYGAIDYLLKPVDNDKVIAVVKNAVCLVEKETAEAREKDELKKQVLESLPALKKNYLYDLVMGLSDNIRESEELLRIFRMKTGSCYEILLLKLDYDGAIVEDELRKLMFWQQVMDICSEIVSRNGFDKDFNLLSQDELVCILGKEAEKKYDLASKAFSISGEIREKVNELLGIMITIGISNAYEGLSSLHQCYRESQLAITGKLVRGTNSIIHIRDIALNDSIHRYPIEYERKLLNAIGNIDMESADNRLKELFDFMLESKINSIGFVQRVSTEIVTMISRLVYDMGGSLEEALGNGFNPVLEIRKLETLASFSEYIHTVISKVICYMDSKRSAKARNLIGKALEYIQENLNNDISVEEVSSVIGISNNYFSLLFKQESGTNFIDYLTTQRIQMAKKLLRNKNLKIYEICEMIGYHDAKYFSQVFKKETGLTPNDYRNSLP